jgi:hypothetical protein
LADEIGLLRGKVGKIPRKYFTLDSYKKVQSFHWEEDWLDYVHEGTRVDNTNMINGHAYTSARLSEICQATYKVGHSGNVTSPIWLMSDCRILSVLLAIMTVSPTLN